MPAEVKTWTGQAPAIKQVDTITVTNTWADGDSVALTVGNASHAIGSATLTINVSVGGTPSTSDVASMIAAAINAGSATSNIQNAETRNVGGQELPQFRNILATVSGNVVTLTAKTAGLPFIIAAVATTSGDGDVTVNSVTASDGPNHIDSIRNYDTGNAFTTLDTLRFDDGIIPALWGMGYFRANNLDMHIVRTTRYRGRLGPPKINSAGHLEYMDRFFKCRDNTGSVVTIKLEEDPNVKEGGITQLDLDGVTPASVDIRATGNTADKTCTIIGGTFTLSAGGGNIILGPDYEAAPATAASVNIVAGGDPKTPSALNLVCGPNSGIANGNKSLAAISGTVHVKTPLYEDGSNRCAVTIGRGGLVIYDSPGSHSYTVGIFPEGSFVWIVNDSSGATTNQGSITVSTGACFDMSQGTANLDTGGQSITVYGGANIKRGNIAPDQYWNLVGCSPEQVNVL